MKNLGWGFQKFYGQEVLLRKPHELKLPILMDASVRQTDGYRFMYVLPLDENRLLIEDTFYSNTFDLNHELSAKEIAQYAQQNSWEIQSVERTESGCLPLPTTSALSMATAPLQTKNNFTCALGMGGGFFHPVTGYSFPWAVRVAEAFSFESGATSSTLSGSEWASKYETLKQEFQDTESFYLLLNRLMFHGATTASRRAIFDRFYRLPESTIKRFYAGRSHWGDRVRLLAGKPPIPLTSAISAILKRPPTLTQGTGENFK
jgi:lycopene beta-cyclase